MRMKHKDQVEENARVLLRMPVNDVQTRRVRRHLLDSLSVASEKALDGTLVEHILYRVKHS